MSERFRPEEYEQWATAEVAPDHACWYCGEETDDGSHLPECIAHRHAKMLQQAAETLLFADAADDLLRRLSGWDDLPGRADGPFWLSEIARVRAILARQGDR